MGRLVKVTSPQSEYTPKNARTAPILGSYGYYVPPEATNPDYNLTSGLQELSYYYDEVGNRRKVHVEALESGLSSNETHQKDYYYTYDSANRLIDSQAADLQGSSQEGARHFSYDTLGRRREERLYSDDGTYEKEVFTYIANSGLIESKKAYDSSNALTANSDRLYDYFGRMRFESHYAVKDNEDGSKREAGELIKGSTTAYRKGGGSFFTNNRSSTIRRLLIRLLIPISSVGQTILRESYPRTLTATTTQPAT